MLVKDVFKVREKTGDVGIEIELEGTNLPVVNDLYWMTTNDPSLKGGKEAHEYVLNCPVKISVLQSVLEDFKSNFKKSEVDHSIYSGTHVHINVQNLTLKQLINYICAFIIVEELLVDWCGEVRTGNHFCLRTSDARWLIDYIRNTILDERVSNFDTDTIRYSSINLKAIPRYGSLEFRTLDSTLDIQRMMTWVNVLLHIRDKSIAYPSPDVMLSQVSMKGSGAFVREILGPYYNTFISCGWEKKVREGIIRAQDIAFCKDWNAVNYNIFKTSKGIF